MKFRNTAYSNLIYGCRPAHSTIWSILVSLSRSLSFSLQGSLLRSRTLSSLGPYAHAQVRPVRLIFLEVFVTIKVLGERGAKTPKKDRKKGRGGGGGGGGEKNPSRFIKI